MISFKSFIKEGYVPSNDDPSEVRQASKILKINPKHVAARGIIADHVRTKLLTAKRKAEGWKPTDISKAWQPDNRPKPKKKRFEETLEIRHPGNAAVHEIAQSNYNNYTVHKMEHVPIKSVQGGYHWPKKVDNIAHSIKTNNWFEPIVIDKHHNVIEGQHRLRAMTKLKAKTIPAIKIEEHDE